jgi:cyclic beta-1,2-glucan synthetase
VYAGPIRGELLGAEHLADRARQLAKAQQSVRERRQRRLRPRPARLLIRLGQSGDVLEGAYTRLSAAAALGTDIGPAGEWLLDNFHVVREHVTHVEESLPEAYFRELPLLVAGPLAEYPRVYEIAITLISHTEGRIEPADVERFVAAYQESVPLSLGELWAVPAMLRLGLIESIRRMALRTLQRLEEVERADQWAQEILRDSDGSDAAMRAALARFVEAGPSLQPAFVSRLLQQLRATAGAPAPLVGLELWYADEGIGPTDAATRAAERLALTTLVMSNSILSLRSIAQRDWRDFVERLSAVEGILRQDPAGDYARMTFATRDSYRHAVERVAKASAADEREVARVAIGLAEARVAEAHTGDSRRAHVGYWLVDRGVTALESAVGYDAPLALRVHRWVLRHPNFVYVGGIMLGGTVALLPVILAAKAAGPLPSGAWLLVLAVAFLPAFDIAVNVMSQLVTAVVPPRMVPKLDFGVSGVPEACRTAVVIPTLLPSVESVQEALENLEVQYLANKGAHLHFAVLGDFTDAPVATLATDGGIVAAATEGIRALNARYAAGRRDVFYLFHRPRRWNAAQGVWMGWERKRGKLAEFNRYLRGGARDAFSIVEGDVTPLRDVKYVITLDADTVLPPDTAAALIGAIAHPLNRAVYDPVRSRVVAGYGILQPRVGVSLASAHRSRFSVVHSGHPGVDPYTTAVSDVYQDLYGEGSFTGKGIYDVDAFETATHGRFPENSLLSHDLIEGSYARAGLVTDITVFDDYPARYLTHARRKHRWIRGDWQLLRWLTRWVPGPDGDTRNRLGTLSRWKILDNLRRSTTELAQFAFILAGWTLLPGSPLVWTLLGVLAVAAPWIIALLLAVIAPSGDKSLRAYYSAVGRDAITSAQQFALAIAFLPHHAWLSADAIVRTLWRLGVSKRMLLEWQSAALAERTTSGSVLRTWQAMWPAAAVPLVVGAWRLWRGATSEVSALDGLWPLIPPVLPLAGLWLAAPFVAYAMSLPYRRRTAALAPESRAVAQRYARAHWEFFARFVNADSAWLAPDNVQEDPERVVALRTSPTNIGLQLLSTVSAYDLGFIAADEMVNRLEHAFASLGRLPRHRGHFLNWYALPELQVLEPAYVSTVDSGNLAGHLIALREGSREIGAALAPSAPALVPRLDRIASLADRYVHEMDFRFLYDESRKLFVIGYNASTHRLDSASYDLLASEARLASFVAVAKDEVPPEHWFHLGRSLTWAHGRPALVSWSGSMFEYLMPILVMRAYRETLLGRTYAASLERQIRYGEELGSPWGLSESAYNVRDRHLTYQYRAFGVPDLALQRGLGRDHVIAPYASGLATMVDPERALANLQGLERLGALSEFGFYDALDYTRPAPDRPFALVRCLMAHHVGMTLVALTNTLVGRLWQERFHADPMVRAASLLLDERVPRHLVFQPPQARHPEEQPEDLTLAGPVVREYDSPDTQRPHVALLGHAPLTVMVTHAGGGLSRFEDLAVTRWLVDGTRDNTGQFVYVRDRSTGRYWSSGHAPTSRAADAYRASLATDRVTLLRRDGALETRTEIVVVPEDAAEVRRITVTNTGPDTREVELTSYGEIVLAPRLADRAHPAFSKLFVETEWHEWCHAITATRRPRSAGEPRLWLMHVVDSGDGRVGNVEYETDRARFISRGRSTRDPEALVSDAALSGTTGAVLDPIFAIRTRVRLGPGQSASVAFTTLVAKTRARAFELADRYHGSHAAQRALDLAWTSTQVELRELGISPTDAAACQDLAGYILFPDSVMREDRDVAARKDGWQQTLWAHGISGDWPVVVATVGSADGLPTVHHLLTAHRYWKLRGVTVDLVVVVDEPQGYLQDLQARITALALSAGGSAGLDASGGVHVRNREALGAADFATIRAVARLAITCDGRTLPRIAEDFAKALEGPQDPPLPVRERRRRAGPLETTAAERRLRAWNGHGGLTAEDNYQISVRDIDVPPAPWANVIANAQGGVVVTESGGGFVWAGSSYFFRLTPWSNDPVTDPVGEALYLRDEETGEFWSLTPAPVRGDAPYDVEHAPGRSVFRHERDGIATRLSVGMAPEDAVKLGVLDITNREDRPRRLTLTSYTEWTLGVLREQTQHRVRTQFEPEAGAILASNPFDPEFASWVAFAALSEPVESHTGERREFIGRNGSLRVPAAMRRKDLGGRTGLGVDPCAGLRATIELAPGETRRVAAILGAAAEERLARQLLERYRDPARASAALEASCAAWERRLGVLTVRTPEPLFDAIVNRWSLYQAMSCRMWARSALYQSGGAYGFRDQLQDVMAFVYAEPQLAREHLLRAAARQFVEGDVQHWWHPASGRGVRTRISDDLAWLPYVATHYVHVTGDFALLDEAVPYLTMRGLEPDEHEAYELPRVSDERGSVYEHCVRALRRACTHGERGLPLIGIGDWNDGMNRVGKDGRGESVWLAWFLITVLRGFAPVAEARGDAQTARECLQTADAYAAAAEAHGWDGQWYRRAFFDDGTPLGSAAEPECQIDAIAQSWSVISGAADPVRAAQAMRALDERLVDRDARLIRLLAPPFDRTPQDPGYIKGYVPGVRENGAQYTHAALWAVQAAARLGDGARALEWFQLLNPFTHGDSPERIATYRVEPYVVAADVYTAEGSLGRGGWTWYTGAASWMYRVGLEAILGFQKEGDTLRLAPCVPATWPEFTVEYRFGRSVYTIVVERPGLLSVGGATVALDGVRLEGPTIPLRDDGRPHVVLVAPA